MASCFLFLLGATGKARIVAVVLAALCIQMLWQAWPHPHDDLAVARWLAWPQLAGNACGLSLSAVVALLDRMPRSLEGWPGGLRRSPARIHADVVARRRAEAERSRRP